jgi:hypothetical protein
MSNATIKEIKTYSSNFVYKNFVKIIVDEINKIEDTTYQVKKVYYTDSSSIIQNNNVIVVKETVDYFGIVKKQFKMLIKDVIVTIGDDKKDFHIDLNVEILQ